MSTTKQLSRPPPAGMKALLTFHVADHGEGWLLPVEVCQCAVAQEHVEMRAAQMLVSTSAARSYVSDDEARRLELVAGPVNLVVGATLLKTYPVVVDVISPNGWRCNGYRLALAGWNGSGYPLVCGRDLLEQFSVVQVAGRSLMLGLRTERWPAGGEDVGAQVP
jgi:hypothetical protein